MRYQFLKILFFVAFKTNRPGILQQQPIMFRVMRCVATGTFGICCRIMLEGGCSDCLLQVFVALETKFFNRLSQQLGHLAKMGGMARRAFAVFNRLVSDFGRLDFLSNIFVAFRTQLAIRHAE